MLLVGSSSSAFLSVPFALHSMNCHLFSQWWHTFDNRAWLLLCPHHARACFVWVWGAKTCPVCNMLVLSLRCMSTFLYIKSNEQKTICININATSRTLLHAVPSTATCSEARRRTRKRIQISCPLWSALTEGNVWPHDACKLQRRHTREPQPGATWVAWCKWHVVAKVEIEIQWENVGDGDYLETLSLPPAAHLHNGVFFQKRVGSGVCAPPPSRPRHHKSRLGASTNDLPLARGDLNMLTFIIIDCLIAFSFSRVVTCSPILILLFSHFLSVFFFFSLFAWFYFASWKSVLESTRAECCQWRRHFSFCLLFLFEKKK